MNRNIDYMAVFSHGVGILRYEQLRQFIKEISGQKIKRDNQQLSHESEEIIVEESVSHVIVKVLNLVIPTKGCGSLRRKIIERARVSSDPNGVCRRKIQRLVQREIARRSYTAQQRQIYRQVAKAVLELETEGTVQSNMPLRRKAVTRFILEHRREGESPLTIAQKLNKLGYTTENGEEWTQHEVSEILIECGGPLKKVGLKSWGQGWLRRISRTDHRGLVESLDPIPLNLNEDLPSPKHQPKLFDHSLLRKIIPRLLETNDSALKIGQITKVIEEKFIPPPYRANQEVSLYYASPDDDEGPSRKLAPIEVIPNADSSVEETLKAAQIKYRLTECLSPREREIFIGRLKGESMRTIADQLGMSLGTVANRMRSIRTRAVQLGLEVETGKSKRDVADQ